MTKTKSLEYYLRYIRAALEVLEMYLLSEDVFWPIGVDPPDGDPDYPRLTLDGLLLAQVRSEAYPKSPEQKEQVERVTSKLGLMRSKWRVAWEKKASQCYRVRMRMWGDFIQEYQDNPQDNADRYGYEVRLRVMLDLLKSEFGLQNPAEVELLDGLDGYLKMVLIPGSFIWEAEIRTGFPPGEYWYLYGKLPPIDKEQLS
jgi:hypothetical protein